MRNMGIVMLAVITGLAFWMFSKAKAKAALEPKLETPTMATNDAKVVQVMDRVIQVTLPPSLMIGEGAERRPMTSEEIMERAHSEIEVDLAAAGIKFEGGQFIDIASGVSLGGASAMW